ncbi:MAG TPA: helix-turn-helix transcriptional regulator, partial [Actinomycetota bacterium]
MIGNRLRRLRLAKGMTQRELASPNYTHAYVSTIEAGRRRPSREAVEYFASKLGVGADELLTGRPPDLAAKLQLRLQEARHALSDGRIEQGSESMRAVAKEAKRFGLTSIEAKAEEGIGLGLERLGRPDGALAHYERAEKILRNEAPTALVDAVAGKARCLHSLGDVRYAIHLLESLLGELTRQKLHDPDALTRIHAGLVYSYLDVGLYTKAAESASELDQLAPR